MQHKKRGRPRLRDDRDSRFDPSRFGHPPDASIKRPLSLYVPPSPIVSSYDDPVRRTHSYRVLKSHNLEAHAPRFLERGLAADANILPTPLSMALRVSEPAAFLTMDLEIAKASDSFTDAVGRSSLRGLRLFDIVAPSDREKATAHHRQMLEEQTRREPNYLPPIFGKQEEERVIRGLDFSPEQLSKYTLDRQEYLVFIGQDGHQRSIPIRLGLAKQDSIYFVVVLLMLRSFSHPTPGSGYRDMSYGYQAVQRPYTQPAPVPIHFDSSRRFSMDTAYSSAQGGPPAPMSSPSSYAASPERRGYRPGASSYQVLRSDFQPGGLPAPQPSIQLPPIQSQQSGQPSGESQWSGEDRQRVDIGGLIDRFEPSSRPH